MAAREDNPGCNPGISKAMQTMSYKGHIAHEGERKVA